MTRRKVVFDYDPDPDFSWLDQDMYKPGRPGFSPIYRSEADMREKRNPIDPDWYRDPENHVVLLMLVYEMTDDDDWTIVDSLGDIDFLADDDDWRTGTDPNRKGRYRCLTRAQRQSADCGTLTI